jgi:hypothetical protein
VYRRQWITSASGPGTRVRNPTEQPVEYTAVVAAEPWIGPSCFDYEIPTSYAEYGCAADSLEPNDRQAEATPLASAAGLTMGGGDIDWFTVDLAPGESFTTSVHSDELVFSAVYDPDGNFVGYPSFGITNNRWTPQTYRVQFTSFDHVCTVYDIEVGFH